MASVALASGEWCWLHGSDDLIADGALRAVLDATTDAPDAVGITVARALFDLEMADERMPTPPRSCPRPERSRTITDPREGSTRLAVLHTYLTSQVGGAPRGNGSAPPMRSPPAATTPTST